MTNENHETVTIITWDGMRYRRPASKAEIDTARKNGQLSTIGGVKVIDFRIVKDHPELF